MAQQQSVLGIFGLTPEMYSQRRQNELEAEQMAVGRMSSGPGSLLNPSMANIYGLATQQGQMIGQGVRGLLGVEDPQMQMVRDVTQMRSQFDVSTPEGLRSFAQALGQRGYTDLAIQATARAADIDKDIALAVRARRESTPAAEETAKRIRLNELVEQFGDVEGARRFNQEQLEGRKSVAKAGAPVAEQQDKALRDARVKKLLDYEDRASSASQTLQLVQDFNSVLNKAFTGTASGAKLTAGQVASALGVTVTGTSESEQLDQLFAALTVGQAKNLKGALSDKDVKFLKEAVGSRGLTKETLTNVINRIAREAEVDKGVYDKASSFQGDFAKFDFAKAQDETRKEVNDRLAKQQRLMELRRKQGQTGQ